MEKFNGEKSPDKVVNKNPSPHHDSKDGEEEFGLEIDEAERIRHRGRDFRDPVINEQEVANSSSWNHSPTTQNRVQLNISNVLSILNTHLLLLFLCISFL